MIRICACMLTSANSYQIMQLLNGLSTLLPLLLPVKQEFPIGGIIISMSNFRSGLKEMPFVKCPANSVSQLYDQYVQDLSCVLDRHAPLVSSLKMKQRADWLSESYRLAKSLRHQFERAWRKDKSQYKRSRLRRQIAWCNRLANRDKTVYYRKLISDNSHDSKKLWQELHKVLHRSHGTTLPSCESSKSLADRFATFFSNKILKIREFFFI